jgi:alpha-galactosidase
MLRVGDCPCDILKNRFNIVNLRYTSGKTAVHSDMIMWNTEDTPENAALQFASVLYSVPQVSMRVDKLPESHYKMLEFYLSFWRKYRETLLDGKLIASSPECEYSLVCSTLGDTSVYTSYSDTVIPVKTKETVAVNASAKKSLIIKDGEGKEYTVLNCLGDEIEKGVITASLQEINVPTAGIIKVIL